MIVLTYPSTNALHTRCERSCQSKTLVDFGTGTLFDISESLILKICSS